MSLSSSRRGDEAARNPPPADVSHSMCDEEEDLDRDKDEEGEGEGEDSDEAGSSYSSASEDLLPPINRYGHTYHGSGRLLSPIDASEVARLALQHGLLKLCLDGALFASRLPLDPARSSSYFGSPSLGDAASPDSSSSTTPRARPAAGDAARFRVLDVGTGSGIWACEMAQRYPRADVLGVDLSSAMLPPDVPRNLAFEVADVDLPWPPGPPYYDLIHIRGLASTGGVRDWDTLLAGAFGRLRPGGTVEFTDLGPRFFDVDPKNSSPGLGAACQEFERLCKDMSRRLGFDHNPIPRVGTILRRAGARRVREQVDWLPVSVRGGDPVTRRKGELLTEILDRTLDTWTLMLFGRCGWDEKDTRALVARVKEEMRDPRLRSGVKATFITATKPLDAGPVGV